MARSILEWVGLVKVEYGPKMMPDHETDEDRLKRFRREHAMWTLEGMMSWCLEHGEEKQLEALTNLEVVLNDLMVENAKLRAATPIVDSYCCSGAVDCDDIAGDAA